MRKPWIILAALLISLTLITLLTGCSALDVIGKDAVRAFGDMLAILPAESEGDAEWRVNAPDKSAWFRWDNQGMVLGIDARPFIEAGLDPSKYECVNDDGTIVFLSLGFNMLDQNPQKTPLAQFEKDAGYLRKHLGYHMEMDHYNIEIGDGNMFEWAKDMGANDKDIVFVLDPAPLIAAGVNPEAVDGWAYAQVAVHIDGKPTDVWKFLKPFNLR